MTDILTIVGLLIAWVFALAIMPKLHQGSDKVIVKPLERGQSGTYDPTTDQHKIMNGEVESYFD
jgi:hypothetical protein